MGQQGIKKGWVWRGRGIVWRTLAILFILMIPAPILALLIFRFVPVPGTPEMLLSLIEGKGADYSWSDDISPRLERAVIGSEDQNFCTHHGFDWKSIDKSVQDHKRHPGKPMRGASTISQQTARTLFLVPARSWIRKGLEAWLTVLMEELWPKKRILHTYLNLVDWGDGIFGAQAAAQSYFGTDAGSLDSSEAARLAAILPNPHKWRATHPGRYVRHRTVNLEGRSAMVVRDDLDFCVK
jgi:monofunctional glycosyltransferase